ncbi:DotD/TraH family lipoprotein [Desulfovibrio sp. OttesenSCG-928-G15]|nr:DotD/TraH family lipoprotein [Desulfovibrio sp. OttesenSCG-928-G15]
MSSPADFVATTLGEAAEQAHGELAMLAKLRGQGMQPLLPPSEPSLEKLVSVSWTGPAAGALKEICLQLGYRYEDMGSRSAQPLNIVVHGLNRPAYVLLEDIAWQIQPQAVLRVDPISRVITLARTVKVGG